MGHMSYDERLERALEYLNRLINCGVEYPDAEWRAMNRFNVASDKLRDAYDNQFVAVSRREG